MRLADALRGAFSHRLRAALTVLGVAIGTGSIVLLASLLHGGKLALLETEQRASNDDVIEVRDETPSPEQRERTTRPLSRADAAALGGAAESSFDAWARAEGRRKRVALVSADPATMGLYRLKLARGRALESADAGRRVCVIGHEVDEELRSSAVVVDGVLFRVVGVLEEKPLIGSSTSTYRWDRKVLIPGATFDVLYAPAHNVRRIYVRPPGLHPATRAPVRAALVEALLARHLGVRNFALAKDESGGKEALIMTVIEVLVLASGVLALFASGINIMNVMLVTVAERRREIGLRRAIGASRRNILVQFLLEATALSLVGAMVGVLGGVALAWAGGLLARRAIGAWEFGVPAWSIGVGVGLALAAGLGFGLWPAWRAARVVPIEALRGE